MDSEYVELEAIARLEHSTNPEERHTGELLAKHFERLMRREYSQRLALARLRADLQRLPAGPARDAIAAGILQKLKAHNAGTLRDAEKIIEDAQRGIMER